MTLLSRLSELSTHREVRRTIRSWAAYAWGPLIALGTAPLIARALGPENRGALAAVMQPMTVADAIAAAGLPAAMTYFVARGVAVRSALRQARWVYYPLGTLAAVILCGWAVYLSQTNVIPLYYSLIPWLLVVPFGAYIASRRGVWQGLGRYLPLDVERALSPSVRLLLVIVLYAVGAATAGPYIAAYVVASLSAAVALFWPFGSQEATPRDEPFDRRVLAGYSLKSAWGTVAVALNNRFDQAILPALISLSDLGLYSVAVVVAEVPMIFTTVLARNLLAEAASGKTARRLSRTLLLGSVAVALCCCGIVLLTPVLVPFIFGQEFSASVIPIIILVLGSGIAAIGLSVTAFLSGRGYPGRSSYAHAVGAAATIILYALLYQHMTLLLACWISVTTQGLIAISSVVIVLLHFKGSERLSFWKRGN